MLFSAHSVQWELWQWRFCAKRSFWAWSAWVAAAPPLRFSRLNWHPLSLQWWSAVVEKGRNLPIGSRSCRSLQRMRQRRVWAKFPILCKSSVTSWRITLRRVCRGGCPSWGVGFLLCLRRHRMWSVYVVKSWMACSACYRGGSWAAKPSSRRLLVAASCQSLTKCMVAASSPSPPPLLLTLLARRRWRTPWWAWWRLWSQTQEQQKKQRLQLRRSILQAHDTAHVLQSHGRDLEGSRGREHGGSTGAHGPIARSPCRHCMGVLGIQEHLNLRGSVWQSAFEDDNGNCCRNCFPTWRDRCLHQHPECAEAQGGWVCQSHSRGLRGPAWRTCVRPWSHWRTYGLAALQLTFASKAKLPPSRHWPPSWTKSNPARPPFMASIWSSTDSPTSRRWRRLRCFGSSLAAFRCVGLNFAVESFHLLEGLLICVDGWSGAWCSCLAFFHVSASLARHRVESQVSTWHDAGRKTLATLCFISNAVKPKVPQVSRSLWGECGKIPSELDHRGSSQLDTAERSCRKAKSIVGQPRVLCWFDWHHCK